MIFLGFGGDGREERKMRGFRSEGTEEQTQNWSKRVWIKFSNQKAPFKTCSGQSNQG